MTRSTHLDDHGRARMVDVSDKTDSVRRAVARGEVLLGETAFRAVRDGSVKKGDVLAVAQLAGIQAAKKTPDLIPLCHPLPIGGVKIDFDFDDARRALGITAEVSVTGKTGVEMEALTAVAGAALAVYDMIKSITKDAVISEIRLLEKSGGKSGDWKRAG
ncbi:MAG: cyclic pyranopterin monophosphate synthase MoaC [Deltaproteobacteria bacterium]|nr:cyclic pyranopterin monophosphate synthase MoaC [Deltaproteobacteria bacterium]